MNETLHKIVSVLIILLFIYVITFKFILPSESELNGKEVSLEESRMIHRNLGGAEGDKPLTLFVTSWCPSCKALESALKNLKIPYARADIEKDRNSLLHYERITQGKTSAIPVVVAGGKIFVGYRLHGIIDALNSVQ